jgi:hypothetical protein
MVYWSRTAVARAIAEADRLDPGWRMEAIEARRAVVPDGRNAAKNALAVRSLVAPSWLMAPGRPALEDLPSPLRLNEVQARSLRMTLEEVRPALAVVREMAEFPTGRFASRQGEDSFEVGNAAAVSGLDLLDRVEAGDVAGAWRAWWANFHAGRAVSDEPMLGSQVRRRIFRDRSIASLERVLAQSEPDDSTLAAVQQSLTEDESHPFLLTAARGYRAELVLTLERVLAQAEADPFSGWQSSALAVWQGTHSVHGALDDLPFRLPAQFAAAFRHVTQLVEAAKRPVDVHRSVLSSWRYSYSRSPPRVAGQLNLLADEGQEFIRSHALARSAVTAVAAERFRLRRGRWPATVDELVAEGLISEVPIDPENCQSLQVRPTADGITVYSVGMDGVDNGGSIRRRRDEIGSDVGVRLWNPTARRQPPE